MLNFKNFNVQDCQQKPTPTSTSRNTGQLFINDAELSQDSYKNTNYSDSYSELPDNIEYNVDDLITLFE